jgi:hypothetical protein
VESRVARLPDGHEVSGEILERQLQRMIAYRKLLQIVTRRGNPPEIVTALLQLDARDKSFFEHREKLDILAARMTTPIRSVSVSRDDEHNTFTLDVEDRSHGYPRPFNFGVDFVSSGEYRTLAAAFREMQEITFPVVVRTLDAAGGDRGGRCGRRRCGRERGEPPVPAQATGRHRRKKPTRRLPTSTSSSSSSSLPARRVWRSTVTRAWAR